MVKKISTKPGDALKEAAREIGSRLGEARATASRVVEGMKAAVKASVNSYSGKRKKAKKRRNPRAKRPRQPK